MFESYSLRGFDVRCMHSVLDLLQTKGRHGDLKSAEVEISNITVIDEKKYPRGRCCM